MRGRPRDHWREATEALLEQLRTRKTTIAREATEYKTEAERRLLAYRAELDAVKAEITAVEAALDAHTARQDAAAAVLLPGADPAVRMLPTPASKRREATEAPPEPRAGRGAEGLTVSRVKRWVREHNGLLVTKELTDYLYAQGWHNSRESAASEVSYGLAQIGTGFERVGRGVYRFYALDGHALYPDGEHVAATA